MRPIHRTFLMALAAQAAFAIGPRAVRAQAPVYYTTPGYAAPARTYVAAPATRGYAYPTQYRYRTRRPIFARRYATPTRYAYPNRAAPTYTYSNAAPTYTYPNGAAPAYSSPRTPFGRYRRAVDAGRDPNWASGRGVRLFKPWEY